MIPNEDVISLLKQINENTTSSLSFWGSIASIFSIILATINTLLIWLLYDRRIKKKLVFMQIKEEIEKHKKILRGRGDMPSDILRRIHNNLDMVLVYKVIFFRFKLKKLIKQIKTIQVVTGEESNIIQKLEFIKIELEEF